MRNQLAGKSANVCLVRNSRGNLGTWSMSASAQIIVLSKGIINDDLSNVGEYIKDLPVAHDDCLENPIDYRFAVFKCYYFQPSYMGSKFAKEITDDYFRLKPLAIQQRKLYSDHGHESFFLDDNYGLGFPLCSLLSQVQVEIKDREHGINNILEPLMAIENKSCKTELTAPMPLFKQQGDCDSHRQLQVSKEILLGHLEYNINRIESKGFCVTVRYQGLTIYPFNEFGGRI